MRVRRSFEKGEYNKYIKDTMPKSDFFPHLIKAFVFGGGICLGSEVLKTVFMNFGLSPESASAWLSVVLISIGSFLTAIGVYDILGKYAGAGSIVPITGFANSIVASAMEYKHEGLVLGVGARMFTVAGPVLVYGFFASVIAGVWYFFFGGVS